MLNYDYKKKAIKDLQKVYTVYINVFKKSIKDMERLQSTRNIAIRTIQYVERYVISLANRPREFDTKLGEIKVPTEKNLEYSKEQNPLATDHWHISAEQAFKESVARQVSAYIERL